LFFYSKFLLFLRYLNGAELNPSDTSLISVNAESNDFTHRLKLDKLVLKDTGEIVVIATNSEGVATSAAFLTVKGTFSSYFLYLNYL